jgi:Xaa-Pro aminopeptidase
MTDVLIYGDTIRHPELRHEVPLTLGDPFLYAEHDGRRHIAITDFEWPRIQEAGVQAELISPFKLGLDELLDSGMKYWEIGLEMTLRAVQHVGVTEAIVPHTFPLMVAEHLRANGIDVSPEREFFDLRRRVKNETELAGIRRAQRAAEAGMDAARDLFRRAQQSNGSLVVDGEALTSERVKLAIQDAFAKHGCSAEEFIVSHGAQSAIGHNMGSGEIRAGEPIVIDLWPKDAETACYADMTRTYCVGDVPDDFFLLAAKGRQGCPQLQKHLLQQILLVLLRRRESADNLPHQAQMDIEPAPEYRFSFSIGHGIYLQSVK